VAGPLACFDTPSEDVYTVVVQSKRDIMLGQIAIEKGLITQQQLDECIKEQESSSGQKPGPRAPTRPLGIVMLSRGVIEQKDLESVLEEQNRRLKTVDQHLKNQKVEYLFGQLLVKNNLATQLQINKCLEIQMKLTEKGVQPVPRLGELLVEHGFVDKKTVAEVLRMQNKDLLFCTGCGRQFNVVDAEDGKTYKCKECGSVMLRRSMLESLKAEDTSFGFELPTEER
jgi:predicted RNA-binding Zn-ribbon protein involved in translation (DUF1610 family)